MGIDKLFWHLSRFLFYSLAFKVLLFDNKLDRQYSALSRARSRSHRRETVGIVLTWYTDTPRLTHDFRFDSGYFRLPVLIGSSLYVFRFVTMLCATHALCRCHCSFFMLSLTHMQSFYQVNAHILFIKRHGSYDYL